MHGFGAAGAIEIMIMAIIISIIIMMIFAGPVSKFVNNHPTIQILGLSFLILIGVMLLAEGSHLANFKFFGGETVHSIPKGYLYFSIFFSLFVEFLNLKMRKNSKPVQLKNSKTRGCCTKRTHPFPSTSRLQLFYSVFNSFFFFLEPRSSNEKKKYKPKGLPRLKIC